MKLWVFLVMIWRNFGQRDGTDHLMWFSDCWWLAGEWINYHQVRRNEHA